MDRQLMQTRYPRALWRPLSDKQTEPVIVPRVFIVHTMVGFLESTETMFKRDGYVGTESTFGVGGPWDGLVRDGAVWQWQSLDRQADAQYDGNVYATSVETSDGGDPNHPWSEAQLNELVLLGTWWCRQTGHPPKLVHSSKEAGFGYHRQFPEWNRSGHLCPGDVRLGQYVDVVLPGIVRALEIPAQPHLTRTLRLTRPWTRGTDVRRIQALVGAHVDGIYGPATEQHVRTWQRSKHITVDGIFGPQSAKAAGWTYS
jgi:peptidoglycan hydrolase-like protein with peptidoglycan-binding domain